MNMHEVEAAIAAAQTMPRHPKKAYKIRASRLADLYEIKARLYAEAGVVDNVLLASIYRAACEAAAEYSRNSVKFWRAQA